MDEVLGAGTAGLFSVWEAVFKYFWLLAGVLLG
jgi:hypothetical protein